MRNLPKQTIFRFLILIILILALIYFYLYTETGNKFNSVQGRIEIKNILKEFIENTGFYAPLVYILTYSLAAILLIPGLILTFVGAILFGTVKGTIYTTIGATIGALLCFSTSKFLGKDFVEGFFEGKIERLNNLIEENGFKGMLFLRLVPVFPYTIINFASGFTKIKLKDYFLASFIGMIPATFAYTYLFATLGDKVLLGEFSYLDLFTKEFIMPIVIFLIIMIVPFLIAKYKKNK